MSTYEDRMAILERKVAALELRRLYDERKAEESTPAALIFNLREINENMTILLGVASSQEESIKTLRNDLGLLRESMEQRFNGVDRRLGSMEQRFTSLEGKLEQVLHILTTPPKTDK
jgi:predicted  nucleic acid-binding Zn-ribbon protein